MGYVFNSVYQSCDLHYIIWRLCVCVCLTSECAASRSEHIGLQGCRCVWQVVDVHAPSRLAGLWEHWTGCYGDALSLFQPRLLQVYYYIKQFRCISVCACQSHQWVWCAVPQPSTIQAGKWQSVLYGRPGFSKRGHYQDNMIQSWYTWLRLGHC